MVLEKTGITEKNENDSSDSTDIESSTSEPPGISTNKVTKLHDEILSTHILNDVTVDISETGNNTDSGASLSPDSITGEYRNRTGTPSDEEINELYLGNVSAKNRRRRGVYGSPIAKQPDDETSEYGGPPNTIDSLSVPVPERKISTVSFDSDTPEDYSHLRRKRSHLGGGISSGKRISFGGFEEDVDEKEKCQHGRRWSRVSFESNGSNDTASKSDTSVKSTHYGVASHVRRDSIALALNGISLIAQPPNKFSFLDKIKEINWKDKKTYQKYLIHFFVIIVFILSVIFVGLAWYYHNATETAIASSQQIFFDPRGRVLTLSDPGGHDSIEVKLGQDIPSWQLPLNCPVVETGDQSTKDCKWKRHAVLRIRHFYSTDKSIQCYNVSWESLNSQYVPFDCFDIGDTMWYGSSNLTSGSLPIRGQFDFNSNKYSSGNNGVLQSAVEYYWLTSAGVAIIVNSNVPTQIRWNTTKSGKMCIISNFTVPFYDKEEYRLPYLNYTICNGYDMLKTHIYMRKYHTDPFGMHMVDTKALRYPHWSTVSETKSRVITQADVESVATAVTKNGLNCSTIQIDGEWQSAVGDLEFNELTFPNTTRMLEAVAASNCKLAIDVNPYFHFSSKNYNHGVDNELFVKDAGHLVPGLVNWQYGIASVLDVSNPKARAWYSNKLLSLTSKYHINVLRFSYGNADWLPHRPHFSKVNQTPNKLRKTFTTMLYTVAPQLIIDNTAQTQHIGGMISVKATVISDGSQTCFSDIISKSLTLGILGYPYVISDGFRSYHDGNKLSPASLPSKDLFIRWLELSTFFPAISYSISPWSFDDNTVVEISKNMSALRDLLVMPILTSKKMKKDIHKGLGILRPLWMADSTDLSARSIHDQFLVGDNLLVAPIVCEGSVNRNIYIPTGIWNDQLRSMLVVGPKWLTNYYVGLFEIPHFVFMRVHD